MKRTARRQWEQEVEALRREQRDAAKRVRQLIDAQRDSLLSEAWDAGYSAGLSNGIEAGRRILGLRSTAPLTPRNPYRRVRRSSEDGGDA